MITNSLLKTQNAYLGIKHIIHETEEGKFPLGSRIDMHIRLDNFGKRIASMGETNDVDGKEKHNGQAENAHAE